MRAARRSQTPEDAGAAPRGSAPRLARTRPVGMWAVRAKAAKPKSVSGGVSGKRFSPSALENILRQLRKLLKGCRIVCSKEGEARGRAGGNLTCVTNPRHRWSLSPSHLAVT